MEIGEILSDAFVYPFHNIKALVLYVILGVILGIALAGTIAAVATGAAFDNVIATIGSGILGIIISLIISFVIMGYQLDIIKYGINRDNGAPGIEFLRQFVNGFKLFVVDIVYYLIPIIISAILAIIFQHWISTVIMWIVTIIFSLAAFMAECRLAKTEDMGHALAIGDAIGDISRVGILKLLLFIIVLAIITFVLTFIIAFIIQWNSIVGGILLGILGVYIVFFSSRATGLLYSDV